VAFYVRKKYAVFTTRVEPDDEGIKLLRNVGIHLGGVETKRTQPEARFNLALVHTEQERQCTYNVILRRVHETTVAVGNILRTRTHTHTHILV
jgi:hypothetical protein